jgi:hypothetical protein
MAVRNPRRSFAPVAPSVAPSQRGARPPGSPATDRPLFRPDICPVGTDRASVMCLSPVAALAVGCCCCCHRCCQLSTGAAVASRAAPCMGWPASGPGRLRPGPWSLTGVRRGSGVKRDVACTFIRHLSPVLVVPRSLSRLRLEERTRTLSGPSPDPSPARTVAPSRSRGRGPGVHRQSPVRAAISAVSGTPRGLLLRRAPALPRRRSGRPC